MESKKVTKTVRAAKATPKKSPSKDLLSEWVKATIEYKNSKREKKEAARTKLEKLEQEILKQL